MQKSFLILLLPFLLAGCSSNSDHVCADKNKDHKCDVCDKVLSECKDENNDGHCDVCGKEIGKKEKQPLSDEYTAEVSFCGSEFSKKFKEGTIFDNEGKIGELFDHIEKQLEYTGLVTLIQCTKCTTRTVEADKDTFFQIGTGSPAKDKFNPGTFLWHCDAKIYKVEVTAFNYSNPYQDYQTHEWIPNVDTKGHLKLDDIDTSFEVGDNDGPITKTIVKEYSEGINEFKLKSTGGRMLVSKMKITWRA